LDKTGLINDIFLSVYRIDLGRKGLSSDGKEHEGRISYENGISSALNAFKEAQSLANCQIIMRLYQRKGKKCLIIKRSNSEIGF
jgi:hypothetical protein